MFSVLSHSHNSITQRETAFSSLYFPSLLFIMSKKHASPTFYKCKINSNVTNGLLAMDWFRYTIWPLQIWTTTSSRVCVVPFYILYRHIAHTAPPPPHTHSIKTSHCIIVVSHFGDRKWEIDFAYPEARINTMLL